MMPVRVRGRARYDEAYEIAHEPRTRAAILLGQAYSFQGPPGMEFDQALVKEVRRTFDPGFRIIHRVMVFRAATGGEIHKHNWGVARLTLNKPDAPWKLELLARAEMPSGYLGSLERPNLVDIFYPFEGMNSEGIPPEYVPFDRTAVADLKARLDFRLMQRHHDAFKAWQLQQAEQDAEREKIGDRNLNEAGLEFEDRLKHSLTPSTSKVPTGRTPRLPQSFVHSSAN